jgi:hypothetical protein
MLVPEYTSVDPPGMIDSTLDPGPQISTQVPKLEKLERASDRVVEPTVRAAPADAGDLVHASVFSLPAATTIRTPAVTAF